MQEERRKVSMDEDKSLTPAITIAMGMASILYLFLFALWILTS